MWYYYSTFIYICQVVCKPADKKRQKTQKPPVKEATFVFIFSIWPKGAVKNGGLYLKVLRGIFLAAHSPSSHRSSRCACFSA